MTDLTDKLKKGELPDGTYYFKLPNGEIDTGTDFRIAMLFMSNGYDKIEVLEKVPSYEEWQKLNWYAGNGVEENQELKMKNAQLKELLKECRNILNEQTFHRNTILETDEALRNRIVKKAEILQKINEVLK